MNNSSTTSAIDSTNAQANTNSNGGTTSEVGGVFAEEEDEEQKKLRKIELAKQKRKAEKVVNLALEKREGKERYKATHPNIPSIHDA